MPDYTKVSTETLIFLLKKWEDINRQKPTRRVQAKITAIKKALASPRTGR